MWGFFALALLLYTPGVWWGLPDGTGPGRSSPWGTDELAPVGPIHELYGVFGAHRPTFNPQYPLFGYICQFILVAPYYLSLWLTGHVHPAPNFPYGLDDPPVQLRVMTVLDRLCSVLMAAGVTAVAFRTGEVLRDRRTAILAASFVLLLYPMFYYARTSNVDMTALFWTVSGLWLFAECLIDGLTTRRGILLGVFAALATATKDPGYGAFVPVGAVLLFRHLKGMRRRGIRGFESFRAPLYAATASVLVYLTASGLVFRPSRYWQHLFYVTHGGSATSTLFYFRYPPTLMGYFNVCRDMVILLADAMGLPMLLAAAIGVTLWIVQARALLAWTLPALGVFAGVVLPVRYVLLRFVLIVAYVLAICGADAVARAWAHRDMRFRIVGQIAAISIVGWAALRGSDLTYQMLRDSRYGAAEWLNTSLHPGDRVGHVVFTTNLPRLPSDVRTVMLEPEQLTALSSANGPEFIVSIPLQDFEPVHEEAIPEAIFQRLVGGTMGYRQAALLQAPSLFAKRPATFVNPPVRIFIRDDLWPGRIQAGEGRR